MTSEQPHPERCENKMTGDVITLSKDEYERLAAYRKRVIPYMCPDEAKDWQVFFDLVETRTHSSATEPADPAGDCDTCRFVKECAPLYLPPCYNRGAIRAAQTPEVLESLDKLGEYADSEYEEANLSGNEREMRIHLEYTNRIWGIMKSLRGGATQQGGERR